jgi:hypothetical protein
MLPAFMIVRVNGRIEYKEPHQHRAMLNAAAKLIPDRALPVDPSWVIDGHESAIRFTNKPATPPICGAIVCSFHGKFRVGVTANPDVMDAFEVNKVPTLLFVNKTNHFVDSGRSFLLAMRQCVDDCLNGIDEEPFYLNLDFYLVDEHDEEAENFTVNKQVLFSNDSCLLASHNREIAISSQLCWFQQKLRRVWSWQIIQSRRWRHQGEE